MKFIRNNNYPRIKSQEILFSFRFLPTIFFMNQLLVYNPCNMFPLWYWCWLTNSSSVGLKIAINDLRISCKTFPKEKLRGQYGILRLRKKNLTLMLHLSDVLWTMYYEKRTIKHSECFVCIESLVVVRGMKKTENKTQTLPLSSILKGFPGESAMSQ